MKPEYRAWIDRYVANSKGHVLGRCKAASEAMHEAFHELEVVRGHVLVPGWGKRGHFWLETADGEIVDPTVLQFPHVTKYERWKPGDDVRVGACMNCGCDIWRPVQSLNESPPAESVCSANCEREVEAYYENGFMG